MAKKSRRISKRKPRLSPAQMVQPGVDVTSEAVTTSDVSLPSKETSLEEEYHYVITDLKRIGVLALLMLAVLITLAFIVT